MPDNGFDLAEFLLRWIAEEADESLHTPWSSTIDGSHHMVNYDSTRLENTLYLRDVRDGSCFRVTVERIDDWPPCLTRE